MANFTEEDLRMKMGVVKQADGSYKRPSKEVRAKQAIKEGTDPHPSTKMRKVSFVLRGDPMPKQSVRMGKHGAYQPKKMKEREKDYKRQLIVQLPPGFKMFENEVHVRKFHVLFKPLKSHRKWEMEIINSGGKLYHTKRPDLIDNLKKLVFDAMSGIVNKDDGLVCTENDTAKYYSTGGAILIELEGY